MPVLNEPKDNAALPCSGVLPPNTDFSTVEAFSSATAFSGIDTDKGDDPVKPEEPNANDVVLVLLAIAGTPKAAKTKGLDVGGNSVGPPTI